MKTLGIDPGTDKSAWCLLAGGRVLEHGIVSDNAVNLSEITDTDEQGAAMTFLLNYTKK